MDGWINEWLDWTGGSKLSEAELPTILNVYE